MHRTKLKGSRGFTLIELLVVIAIIGILSSIVLASLNNARSRGADAAIKANLSTIRVQAELWAEQNNGTYGVGPAAATCPTTTGTANIFQDPTIISAVTAARAASGGSDRCAGGGTWWWATFQLKSSTGQYWCVDSNGTAVSRTSLPATGATSCS